MATTKQIGVVIQSGLQDWQIVQQDASGFAHLTLGGRWISEEPGVVEVRVVSGDTGVAVSRALDWQSATTQPSGRWKISLRVPAGGLYRLETRFKLTTQLDREWSRRGDMRHFWGVGDLWVIAGQSNSAGYGRGAVYDPPELGIHLFRNSDTWSLAFHPMNDSTDTAHAVNREGANSAHSPYLHFARILKQQLHYPIGLVQTALGGSPLKQWNPTESNENEEALLFKNMLQCVDRSGGAVKGILWYQGESDCAPGLAESYEARFANAVGAWRKALKQPDLPVLTVQLNRYYPHPVIKPENNDEQDRAWSQVREAQRQSARKLSHVALVPTFDLPLSDLIHTGPAGNLLLGERMVRAALGKLYGQPIDCGAPDIQCAKRTSDGTIVELHFDNVTDRLDTIQRQCNAFKIEDSLGDVEIAEVIYPMNRTIQLRLARILSGTTCVHGAFGCNPVMVPVDMDRVMPMLGFYGVAVE